MNLRGNTRLWRWRETQDGDKKEKKTRVKTKLYPEVNYERLRKNNKKNTLELKKKSWDEGKKRVREKLNEKKKKKKSYEWKKENNEAKKKKVIEVRNKNNVK